MTNTPWISVEEVIEQSILEKNIEQLKVKRAILDATNFKVQELLGDTWFNHLCTKRTDELEWTGLTSSETTLINSYLNPVLIQYSIHEYLKSGNFSITNQGIEKKYSQNSTSAESSEIGYLLRDTANKAQFAAQLMVKYICEHEDEFPLYQYTTDSLILPKRNSGFQGENFIAM